MSRFLAILFFLPAIAFAQKVGRMPLSLKSPAFAHNQEIPALYTCEGRDISPELAWSGVPEGTRSLVLIMDDPDAPDPRTPQVTWVHWVLYNIAPLSPGIKEAAAPGDLPKFTLEGKNSWQKTGWGGPCPPIGRHRYFFKLFALSQTLPDLGQPSSVTLQKAMAGKIIDQTELVGTYQKANTK